MTHPNPAGQQLIREARDGANILDRIADKLQTYDTVTLTAEHLTTLNASLETVTGWIRRNVRRGDHRPDVISASTSPAHGSILLTVTRWIPVQPAAPVPPAKPWTSADHDRAERLELCCELMHDAYERAAVGAGWETNPASRKPWSGVPEANKATMRAAVSALLDHIATTDRHLPNLGCATTAELLDELTARIDTDYAHGGGGLGYTTVNGRPESRQS